MQLYAILKVLNFLKILGFDTKNLYDQNKNKFTHKIYWKGKKEDMQEQKKEGSKYPSVISKIN